jgi:hypothetical protein
MPSFIGPRWRAGHATIHATFYSDRDFGLADCADQCGHLSRLPFARIAVIFVWSPALSAIPVLATQCLPDPLNQLRIRMVGQLFGSLFELRDRIGQNLIGDRKNLFLCLCVSDQTTAVMHDRGDN